MLAPDLRGLAYFRKPASPTHLKELCYLPAPFTTLRRLAVFGEVVPVGPAFSPDGKRLALLFEAPEVKKLRFGLINLTDGKRRLWDLRSGAPANWAELEKPVEPDPGIK